MGKGSDSAKRLRARSLCLLILLGIVNGLSVTARLSCSATDGRRHEFCMRNVGFV